MKEYLEKDMNHIYDTMQDVNSEIIITTTKDYDKIQLLNTKDKLIFTLNMELHIKEPDRLLSMINKTIN